MRIGKVSENVLKRSVLRQLHTEKETILCGAGVGEDCAIFSVFGDKKVTGLSEGSTNLLGDRKAICVQEAVIAVEGSPCAEAQAISTEPVMTLGQLIQKCANNLAVGGAVCRAVMLALILPEWLEEPQLKELMREAKEKCKELSVTLAGGQTRVSRAVSMPVAVVTGYGMVSEGGPHTLRAVMPGQDVVISKWVGLLGTSLLAKYNREGLLTRYPAYLVEEAAGFDRYLSVIPEAATAIKSGVCAMHDVSEGGIFGALWELAEGAGVGLTIDLKKIPLRQETVEVCEHCNVNPYELLSGGCLLMTTADGPGLVAALEEVGIPAVIVGKVTDSKDRILRNEDEVRYMDKPKQDEIYRNWCKG